MAISSSASCLLATCLFVVLFAAMQVYRSYLASTQLMTVFGGYLGSLLFIFTLTAIGNLETNMFGKGFQTKLFPEVVISFAVAMLSSGLIHRVCVTTCYFTNNMPVAWNVLKSCRAATQNINKLKNFLFSLVALYYMNKLSAKEYGVSAPTVAVAAVPEKRKRK